MIQLHCLPVNRHAQPWRTRHDRTRVCSRASDPLNIWPARAVRLTRKDPMLKILAPRETGRQFCDGVSRRNFLKIGALGAAGLTLPRLLSLEAQAGIGRSNKSVILIYLVGGPPHQ